MQKIKMCLDRDSDESAVMATFKKQLYSCCGRNSDTSELISRVEETVSRLMANGRKMIKIGSNYKVRQLIEHPGCQVLITVNMSKSRPSIISKLTRIFVT